MFWVTNKKPAPNMLDNLREKIRRLKPGERLRLEDLPEDIYHEAPGVGSTDMKAGFKSMAHFKVSASRSFTFSPQQRKAFAIGKATHCLVLDPHTFEERFVVAPADLIPGNNKKWKEFKKFHEHLEILSVDEAFHIGRMADQIRATVPEYFRDGAAEVSFWYRHETGVILKARVDYELEDKLIDLKTTKHETPRKFCSSVRWEYAVQDALYRLVTGVDQMLFVGVYKELPHSVYLCQQGADVRAATEENLENIITDIHQAREFGEYPDYPLDIFTTSLEAA